MKNLHFIFLFIIVLFFPNLIFACICGRGGTFCETVPRYISYEQATYQRNIVWLRKTGISEEGNMKAEVLSVLWGEACTSEIEILQEGHICRVDFSEFNDRSEWVMILSRNFGDSLYRLPVCGMTYLEVENREIKGPITDNLNEISIDRVQGLIGCEDLNRDRILNRPLLYPNPASNFLTIEWPQNFSINSELRIYDASGRLVKRNQLAFSNEAFIQTIPTEDLPNGMYIVELACINQSTRKKIVVHR